MRLLRLIAVLLCATGVAAGEDRLVFGLQAAYGLENAIPRNISHINMLYAQPQIGVIVWDSPESRLPIKRFEIVSEGIFGAAVHPGAYLLGDTLLFRVAGNSTRRWIPFFNVSSGPLHTNLNEKASELGGHVQFLSQGGAGIQRRLTPRKSIVLEYRYFHMSNAGLTRPNHGFNGSMLSAGMRWNTR
jgi:Lipid A 3-O-deacylase (PagL)